MKKSQLPSKVCLACSRSFNWRKKWQRDWQNVKYCSKRCAGERNRILVGLANGSHIVRGHLSADKPDLSQATSKSPNQNDEKCWGKR